MIVKTISDDFDKYFDEIYSFCEMALKELSKDNRSFDQQSMQNMAIKDWENNPHCLLHRLYVKDDFSNGNGILNLVYDDKKLIALSGAMKYSKDITTVGKRTYVSKLYRNRVLFHTYMLPEQVKWAIFDDAKVCLLCFNKHHKMIYDSVSKCIKGTYVLPCDNYRDFVPLDGMYKIYSTMQYVIAYIIDDEFKIEDIEWEE